MKSASKHPLFDVSEVIKDGNKKLSIARSIVDVLCEALKSVHEEGSAFTGDTVLNVVEAIHKYSKEAELNFNDANSMLDEIRKNNV